MRNLLILVLVFMSYLASAQYLESFNVPNKGYLVNFVDDVTAVNWTLSPWNQPNGNRDAADYFNTTAGSKLECIDLDEEVYWESPLINTTAAPTVSIKMNLTWVGFDTDGTLNDCIHDYIKVMYSVNGGGYQMIPNQVGGSTCATVGYANGSSGPFDSNLNLNFGGVTGGSTLKIRVIVKTNNNAELVTIDEVEVPQAGVLVGCAAPVLTTVVTQVGCSNANSGAIDLSLSGGTPGFTYAWSSGQTTQDLTNRPVGTYTVTVTDAASCTATISAAITNAPAISLSTTVLDATCNGNTDGEIDLVVNGGVPGYTYDWSNDGPETPDNDAQDLVNIGAGTYTVTVTDASGCSATKTAVISVATPGAYMEEFNVPNKGYLTNFVDDFSAVPWTLSGWSPQPPALFGRDNQDYFYTTGGVLTCADLDQEICWTSPLIDLNGGTQFSVALTWTGFDPQADEYISVQYSIDGGGFVTIPNVVGGGTQTIQYNSGSDVNGATTITKTGLSGSTIQIQICIQTNTDNEVVTIDKVSVPGSTQFCPAPEPTLTATNVTCNGGNNGTVTNMVVDGTPPYTYLWSNNATTQNLNNIPAGTYTVTVTDLNMATGTASIMVSQPSAIILTSTKVNVLCNGNATGSIDLMVSGGVSGYSYNWGAGQPTTQDRSGLSAGTYTVTVTDANNCTKTLSTSITEPAAISLTTSVTNVCGSGNTGAIDLMVSGGVPGYSYNWGSGQPTTQDRNGLTAGTYTVTVTDANNCTKTVSATVASSPVPPCTITGPDTTCTNYAGNVHSAPAGQSAYSWTISGSGTIIGSATGSSVTVTAGGTANSGYSLQVTVTNSNGCTSVCSFNTSIKQAPTANAGNDITICQNDVTYPNLNGSVGGDANRGTWSGGNGTFSPDANTLNAKYIPSSAELATPGTPITLTLTTADPGGVCVAASDQMTFLINPSPVVTCPANFAVFITDPPVTLTGGMPAGGTYSGPGVSGGVFTPANAGAGAKTITYSFTNGNNCTGTCTFTITVNDCPTLPNAPANVTIINSVCNASCTQQGGLISAPAGAPCPANSTLQYQVNSGGWSATLPVYDQDGPAQTIKTRCNCDQNSAINSPESAPVTTIPANCSETVLPTITCPANINVNNTTGQCAATVSFSTPVGTDNCPGATTVQTTGLASGAAFPVGTTTNTFRVTDVSGNTATCAFTVSVIDNQLPTITCPANINVNNTTGQCGAIVTFTAPVGADNCPGATTTQTTGLASGSTFPVGTTTNTFRVTDGAGNSATCGFTVTVSDAQAPSITCPANINVNNTTGQCAANVTFTAPVGSDNCSGPITIQTAGLASGASFPVGVTTNTFRVTDASGNTATCNFTVTVADAQAPSITCPASISVNNTTGQCAANVTYTPPVGTDNCSGPTTTQTAGLASGASFPVGVTTNTFRVTDASANTATCSFTVTVSDAQAPSITCPANINTNNINGQCAANVTYTPPVGTDNCSGSTTTQITGLASGASFPVGTTTNTFRVTDAAGNSSTCAFTVTVTDAQLPTITCPANINVNNTTGQCAANVTFTAPVGTDNCPSASTVQTAGLASGASFPVGTTTNTFRVTDASGNTATCNFTVTVSDNQLPTITCPANVNVNNDSGMCSAVFSYSTPAGADNCSGATTLQIAGLSSGSAFPVGTTTNTFQVTDASGNSTSCAFSVTVSDAQAPVIVCPTNISVSNTTGQCAANVTFTAPVGTDNCSGPTTTQTTGLVSGASFPVGTTTNTFRVTDAAGNSTTCAFTVTVIDAQLPTISCPVNISVNNATGQCAANVTFTAPTGSDNCSGATTAQTTGLASGASFPVGTTTNTFRVTDAAGNSSTCTFVVTVTDTQLPTITCPANISVNNDVNQCSAVVTYSTPAGTDNCSGATTTRTTGLASGSAFPVGSTLNTFRVTDASGNSATCAFTVTVTDAQAPVIICPANIAANTNLNLCSAVVNYTAPTGTDNCAGATTARTAGLASGSAFPRGVTVNTFTVTASNGQTASCSFTVTVTDNQPPAITCPANQNINAGASCTNTIGSWSAVSVSDNCTASGSITVTQSPAPTTVLSGHNASSVVTLTANDGNGNTASCSFTVTLKDVTAPVARCRNTTLNLGSNGSVNVLPSLINNLSSDNCTFTLTTTPATLTCANIGINTVVLRATDAGGNTSTCIAQVTIRDLAPPVALCKNPTIFLNSIGQATLTVAQVDNGSTDACGIATRTLSQTDFNCSELQGSTWPVTLTLKDVNGNMSSCVAQVTVKDNIAPSAVCEDITVQLGSNGKVTVFGASLADLSTDNCAVWSYSPAAKIYTTANIGQNNLVITVKDWSGNTATCTSVVTVINTNGFQTNEQDNAPEVADFMVFPNPSADFVHVAFQLPAAQTCQLQLFDMSGRLIFDQTADGVEGDNQITLRLHELASGMYQLHFQSEGVRHQRRLLLQTK